jgi:chemotaxis protein methyltransferase CheR
MPQQVGAGEGRIMKNRPKKELMTEEEYSLLRDLVNRKFGILLKGDKRLTLHAKVSHRLTILGLESYSDYYSYIMSDATGDELFALASHVTNNETYFFREQNQLEVFACILRDIKKQKEHDRHSIRILSVASSSGEEAYSLNMIIQEKGLFVWDWDIAITGIDIDKNALQKAKEACYPRNSFRSLNGNKPLVDKYFVEDGERYRLKRFLTKDVDFRHGNILEEATFGEFDCVDVIFCRNVFIYMSDDAIEKIIKNFHKCISDKGYLFIGSSESLIQKTNLFLPEHCDGSIVYRKNVGK